MGSIQRVLALYQEFVKAGESVELRLWSRGGKECFSFSQTLGTLPHSFQDAEKEEKKGEKEQNKIKRKWNHPFFQGSTYGEVNADSYKRGCVPDDSQFHGDVPDDPQFCGDVTIDSQFRGDVPDDSQFPGDVPVDSQFRGDVPVESQFSGDVPDDSHFHGDVPSDAHFHDPRDSHLCLRSQESTTTYIVRTQETPIFTMRSQDTPTSMVKSQETPQSLLMSQKKSVFSSKRTRLSSMLKGKGSRETNTIKNWRIKHIFGGGVQYILKIQIEWYSIIIDNTINCNNVC